MFASKVFIDFSFFRFFNVGYKTYYLIIFIYFVTYNCGYVIVVFISNLIGDPKSVGNLS